MKKLCLIALCLASFSMNSFACDCTANKTEANKASSEQKCTCAEGKAHCDKCPAKAN